jgi:dTDP-4-amino-4,6-dideoxygalactose transaminase
LQHHFHPDQGEDNADREVPTKDYARQYAGLVPELLEDIAEALLHDNPILGKAVQEFEEKFATAMGSAFAVGVNSGTDALILGMQQAGIGKGDEVITQANTFFATISAIRLVGATPILVDCLEESPAMDIDQVEAVVTPKTKAVIAVHMHGLVNPMSRIETYCRRQGLWLLEDCAQAHGAMDEDGVPVGTRGRFGAFSFHPSKNLGAFGDAGAILCQEFNFAEGIRQRRNLGKSGKHQQEVLGWNSKLDTLQAVVLNRRLPSLAKENMRRRTLAGRYSRALHSLEGLRIPTAAPGTTPVFHHYPVLHPKRDELGDFLLAKGVRSSLHYPVPSHLQPAAIDLGYVKGSFPHAERRAAQGLSLPMAAELHDEEVDRVIAAVQAFCQGAKA